MSCSVTGTRDATSSVVGGHSRVRRTPGEPLMAIQSPIRRGPPSLISSYCRLTDNTVAGAPEAEEQTIKEAHVPAGAGIDEGSRAIKTGAVERRVSPAPRLLGSSERIPQCGCNVSGRARRRQ